jgi:glycosyltransferase involved in cell wall biosynthesis
MRIEAPKTRLLLVSIAPPQNDCGVRVVLHRHLVERKPFELHLVTNAGSCEGIPACTKITLPYPLHRLRRTRFGPRLSPWFADYENLVWTLTVPRELDKAILKYKPDVILTLAETGLCHLAAKASKKHRLPLASLFLDWFPIMKPHYGHAWTKQLLSRRYRALYHQCDLAFCTSDGMQEVLGPHPNSHVIYPMPGRHRIPETIFPPKSGKFRLVYVGSVENFYGRMICSLIEEIEPLGDMEIIVVGPNADWPEEILQRSKAKGIYLGFKPPEEAAAVLTGADALLVVMSFEQEHRLFMETSFTTKFLDYSAFGKPIILWGPVYCTPVRVVQRDGGAQVVDKPQASDVVAACRQVSKDCVIRSQLSQQARNLHETLFDPDRLQRIFVSEIERLGSSARAR